MTCDAGAMSKGGKEQELPIDIQVDKFVDWLVSRQKVPAGWNAQNRDVRAQLSAAVAALPLAIKSNLTAADGLDITDPNALHYWHCTEMLKRIEAHAAGAGAGDAAPVSHTKGALAWSSWLSGVGGSKDATTKQWDTLIKAYQKNNLYLADAARILAQNTVYEIPALKKLIAASAKQVGGLERKIADSEQSAREFQSKYADACRALGIPIHPSADVKAELNKTLSALDPLLAAIVDAAKGAAIGEAVEYYKEFSAQQLQLVFNDQKHADATTSTLLSALTALRASAAAPAAAVAAAKAQAPAAAADDDDFGITVESSGAADAASAAAAGADEDFGITVESAGADVKGDAKAPSVGGGIDWGALGGTAPSDDAAAAVVTTAAAIDWGDGKADAKTADAKTDADGGSGSGSGSGGVKGLDDTDTRNAFVTDLHELECFLATRLTELQAGDDTGLVGAAASASTSASASKSKAGKGTAAGSSSSSASVSGSGSGNGSGLVASQSVDGVTAWLAAVRALLAQTRAPRVQQLLLIRSSKRYVERLVSGVKQTLLSAERMNANARTAEQRLDALRHTLATSERKLRALAAQTLSLKGKVEAALSAQYDGRRVNLFGGELSTLHALVGAAAAAN